MKISATVLVHDLVDTLIHMRDNDPQATLQDALTLLQKVETELNNIGMADLFLCQAEQHLENAKEDNRIKTTRAMENLEKLLRYWNNQGPSPP